MDRRTFHSLDALRGIAALTVVFWHADWLIAPLRPQHGDLAVDLFFVMSGFVIAHAYEARLRDGLGAVDFIVLRLIRLYPLYALGSLIGIGAALFGLADAFDLRAVGWTLAMLPTPTLERGAPLYPYNGVAWSLFLEVIVNIVYALTWRRWTIALVSASAALVVAATILHGNADFGWTWRNLSGGIARVFFGFPMGVLLHRLHAQGRLPIRANFLAVVAATVLVLFFRPERFGVAIDLAALLIAAPAIVACAVQTEPPQWARPAAALLGASSYAIYALHLPLLEILTALAPRAALEPYAPLPGLAFAACVFGLAVFADRWLDAPIRARLARWISRAAPVRAKATAR